LVSGVSLVLGAFEFKNPGGRLTLTGARPFSLTLALAVLKVKGFDALRKVVKQWCAIS
jgi:hypothetical protein